MAAGLIAIASPSAPVYRVAHRPGDPFDPPAWRRARPDGTFRGRFDDPSKEDGNPESARFRAIYCATQRAAAFGETIAALRPPLQAIAGIETNRDAAFAAARVDLIDPEDPRRGLVPIEWRLRRQVGVTTLDPALRFVDLMAAETIHHLRLALAPVAARLGLPDFDASAVMGPHRRLTQACARYIYEQVDEADRPRFAGLRYASRLNPAWSCWALFADRLRHTPGYPETIFPDDPGLLEAAALLGLTVESVEGRFVRPWR